MSFKNFYWNVFMWISCDIRPDTRKMPFFHKFLCLLDFLLTAALALTYLSIKSSDPLWLLSISLAHHIFNVSFDILCPIHSPSPLSTCKPSEASGPFWITRPSLYPNRQTFSVICYRFVIWYPGALVGCLHNPLFPLPLPLATDPTSAQLPLLTPGRLLGHWPVE